MNEGDPGPRVPQHNFFGDANAGLEKLKDWLATQTCFEEALLVSEMLRDLDRTHQAYDRRNDEPM
jgi:hypothetical protein